MFGEKLIAEYPEEYWRSKLWVKRCTTWLALLGINKYPDEVEEEILQAALKTEFRGHSFSEIELALKMSVMDEFAKPVEAYNKLNFRFLANVMNQYRRFRKDVANKYEEIKFVLERPKPVIPTQFENDIQLGQVIWTDFINSHYESHVIVPLGFKTDFLLKLSIVSSEETDHFINMVRQRILDRVPMAEYPGQYSKKKLDEFYEYPALLDVHAEAVGKRNFYLSWIDRLRDNQTTFEQFCCLVEKRIYDFHGVIWPRYQYTGEDIAVPSFDVSQSPGSFAYRISKGEILHTVDDLQYYENNKDEIEKILLSLSQHSTTTQSPHTGGEKPTQGPAGEGEKDV